MYHLYCIIFYPLIGFGCWVSKIYTNYILFITGFYTRQTSRSKRKNLIDNATSQYKEPSLTSNNECETVGHIHGYTSVSLILRPSSSQTQPLIDTRSLGSSSTYSASSSDVGGFQSRLLISIGSGKASSAAPARIRSNTCATRPNSLIPVMQRTSNQSAGECTKVSSTL